MTLVAVHPALAAAETLWTFVLFPAALPYVIWLPRLGPLVAGQAAAALGGAAGAQAASLTGRLENLTLVRAAGAASRAQSQRI
jgi:hypothetical protein